ncbi:metallopeptidase TldD-related protein [Methylococcus sp. ANG]|uniref:TldD/PmbA family protein n=1 Tax=Methylococcus sp. ANG TaxID=3231903 RepID=UPI003458D613
MSFAQEAHRLLERLSDDAFAALRPGETASLSLSGEDQTYLRFNAGKVRQATGVRQLRLELDFRARDRSAKLTTDLSGRADRDLCDLRALLARARSEAASLPPDPFASPLENHGQSEEWHEAALPDPAVVVEQIALTTVGTDFAGLFAAGPQVRAVRNSTGQRHWFGTSGFFLDYSLFTVNSAGENKAVKGLLCGTDWSAADFAVAIEADRQRLDRLRMPSRTLPPGEYRAYLAPAAVAHIVDLLSWGAVSYGAWKKGGSALRRWIEGEVPLSDQFSLRENFALGLGPRFNGLGEVAPEQLPIAERGALKNLLIGARSAREYGVASNGAESGLWSEEQLRSPEILPGDLPERDVLKRLDSGLYIGNLHYLNWSDLQSARVTGMTRYACFLIEHGEIVAPIHDLRFDDSLFRIFGAELEALSDEARLFRSTDTYEQRSLGGCKVPGILLSRFRLTL